jgi:hypothetical protein
MLYCGLCLPRCLDDEDNDMLKIAHEAVIVLWMQGVMTLGDLGNSYSPAKSPT